MTNIDVARCVEMFMCPSRSANRGPTCAVERLHLYIND